MFERSRGHISGDKPVSELAVPDALFRPGAGGIQADRVIVPRDAFDALVKVAMYVSLGRRAVDHQPDGAPYPDAVARRALGTLYEAGLIKSEDEA